MLGTESSGTYESYKSRAARIAESEITGRQCATNAHPRVQMCVLCVPRPPLRKHQPGQESDGQTGSWCLDKAVQQRDAWYQKKACPENLPIPHPNHNNRNRVVLVGLWGMGATLGAPNFNSSVVESFSRVERPMKVAGACSPVDRMYVTAKSGVTTLVMAENHTKTKSSGGQ